MSESDRVEVDVQLAGKDRMTVTTVLGPLPASELGRVDTHEHVFLWSPALQNEEFQDETKMLLECEYVRDSGIETIVDLTPIGLGRRPSALAKVSAESHVNIVAATGFHREAHYAAQNWARRMAAKDLRDVVLQDLTEGIDENDWQGPAPKLTQSRAGVVKLGADYHSITTLERVWFEAGAEAARIANVPVAVHCEVGTAGHAILDLLESMGVAPDRVLLAHQDRNPDPGLHAELAARGAFLGYDTVGRTKYHSDSMVHDLVAAMMVRGCTHKILLGTDVGRRSMLRAYGGGPGMDVLGRVFVPRLLKKCGEAIVNRILTENPARYLTGCATSDGA